MLNLVSMIDVTFLLLIYFMVTTVLTDPEDRLSPTLQTQREEGGGVASDFQPQVLDVLMLEGRSAFRLGNRVFRERGPLLEALQALPTDPGLFVKVFDGAPVGSVATALQVGRDAGFQQVTYVPAK
jgi:biopolymer transport protein ExbD